MASTNIHAISNIVELFVDAFNDTSSAFGSGKSIGSITAYANLLPDVMGLMASVGDLQTEIKNLQPSDYGSIVALLENKLNIPQPKAKGVLEEVLQAIVAVLNTLTRSAGDVEKSMLGHTK